MFQEILQETGLSLNEAKVYEALLFLGEANVQNITNKSKVHRRNVYDALQKLDEKGLVSQTIANKEKKFKATSPERLHERYQEKELKLLTQLPELTKLYKQTQEPAQAQLFRGIEGFKNYLNLILEEKKPVYFIGAKAFWLDERLKHYLPHFEKQRKAKGIKFKHLFDHEVKTKTPQILKLVGKPYKFLPKKYSSSTAIDIFGDYVVTFVGVQPGKLHDEPLQFVLKNKALADGYRKFFEFMWDFCPKE